MSKKELPEIFHNIFIPERKCIINADLDGIISGMLLQQFLNWEICGYSYCVGSVKDALWLKDAGEKIEECVFVDLPVCANEYTVIDQHFVAGKKADIDFYNSHKNKINPNIMEKRVLENKDDYCYKYPFGTAHFILAVMENLGIIDDSFQFNFSGKNQRYNFYVFDLLCRADDVAGNFRKYGDNCQFWADWLMAIGGKNTEHLFSSMKKMWEKHCEEVLRQEEQPKDTDFSQRLNARTAIRDALREIGSISWDGGCEKLFQKKELKRLEKYFFFMENALSLKALPVFDVTEYRNQNGEKLSGKQVKSDSIKDPFHEKDMFSFTYSYADILSYTKWVAEENNSEAGN